MKKASGAGNRHPSKLFVLNRAGRLSAALLLSVLVTAGTLTHIVKADEFDEQIHALQSDNATSQSTADQLAAQASSYADAISQLQVQINTIQAQINANQAEQTRLETEIAAKQAELTRQRGLLGDVVQAMYIDGEISTIEMLATSNNLSDFVDKAEYRNTVQQNIQDSLAKIAKLQSDLKIQKTQVDQLLVNIKLQQAQLAANQSQQQEMYAYTQAQKDQFDKQISNNVSRIAELRRQQVIANQKYDIGKPGDGVNCGGGYPAKWCEIPQDSVIDNWGMYNRECVSYTAFKVHSDFLAGRDAHDMPYWGGVGNANQWDEDAIAAGIPVDNNPTPGSIAISNAGYYGHAMYVESVGTVNGRQAIYVSQYNAGLDGRYSEVWKYTTGLVFLHF